MPGGLVGGIFGVGGVGLLATLALRLVLDLVDLVAVVVAAARADLVADLQLAATRAGHQLSRLDRMNLTAGLVWGKC